MNSPYLVGITGGSASGKTLFLKSLIHAFAPGEISLISQDNYYRPRHEQQVDEKGIHNFDLPAAIDDERYAADIRTLRSGRPVSCPEYTFNNPAAAPRMLTFTPSPIIVVEGIFVLYFPEIVSLLDLKVFIDAKEHVKFKRRIIRDRDERGYDLEDVLYRYEQHVVPAYEKYIEPFKDDADVIIPNNRHFEKGLQLLVAYLKSRLSAPSLPVG